MSRLLVAALNAGAFGLNTALMALNISQGNTGLAVINAISACFAMGFLLWFVEKIS